MEREKRKTEATKRMGTLTEIEPKLNKEEEAYAYALQLSSSVVLPMTLRVAIELGIFDIIAKAGEGAKVSASEIAAQIQSQSKDVHMILDRILRILATHSLLHCSLFADQVRVYSLNSVSKYFVGSPDRVAPLSAFIALTTDKVSLDCWFQLKEAILEGGVPFDRAHGMNTFEYPKVDPRFNQVFNAAMCNKASLEINSILEAYKGFENIKQLVDVGGNLGVTLHTIISKYQHIKGINFDLPHVIHHAQHYPGVEHVAGDMFQNIPKGDAIILKCILHQWDDEQCLKLLKNCYKSITEDGKLIVAEAILPELPEPSAGSKANSQLNIIMFTHSTRGKERTKLEFMNLATGAGFSGIRYECFVRNFWVMEFYK